MNELVLLQVLAALSNVSRHVEEVHHGQAGRVLLFTWRQKLILAATTGKKKKKSQTCCSSNLDHKGWRGSRARRLTSRGLVSLRNVFRSPPAISSSRMNLGMACRLTPTQRTMFWWLNLLQRGERSRGNVLQKKRVFGRRCSQRQIRVWSLFWLNKS